VQPTISTVNKSQKSKSNKSFLALTLLQFRNHISANPFADKKKFVLSILWFVLKFVFIGLLIYAVMILLIYNKLITLGDMVDTKVVVFVLSIMIFVSLVYTIFGITKHLYFDIDNKILLSMPLRANAIFISKILVYFFNNFKRNLLFFLPFLIVVGIFNRSVFEPSYYIVMILSLIVLTVLIVSVAALLSIPAMFVAMFFKNFPPIKFVVYLAITVYLTYLVFRIIAYLPEEFDLMQQLSVFYHSLQKVFDGFSNALPFMKRLVQMIVGEYNFVDYYAVTINTFITFLVVFGIILASNTIVYFGSRPLFLKMAASSFEYRRNRVLLKKHNSHNVPLLSHIKKELLTSVRSAELFAKDFGVIVILPLVLFLLNKIFAAMDLSPLGEAIAMSVSLLMMSLIVLCMNSSIASCLSREGAAFYHLRTTPQKPLQKIVAKIAIKVCTTIFAIITTVMLIAFYFEKITAFGGTMMVLITLFIALGHAIWCIELDIVKPLYRQYSGESTNIANRNETKAYSIAFVVSILLVVVAYWLLMEGVNAGLVKLAFLAAGFLAIRIAILAVKIAPGFRQLMNN